jgi:hypothetical protein
MARVVPLIGAVMIQGHPRESAMGGLKLLVNRSAAILAVPADAGLARTIGLRF